MAIDIERVGYRPHRIYDPSSHMIIRDGQIIMPRGRDMVLSGDRVIIFALPTAIHEIERLFS